MRGNSLQKKLCALLLAIVLLFSAPVASAESASDLPKGDSPIESVSDYLGDSPGLSPANGVDIDIDFDGRNGRKASIDEDFRDDRVIVVLKHAYSKVNKEWAANEFKVREIEPVKALNTGSFKQSDIVDIVDRFRVDDPENNPLVNWDEFHQILEIKLKNPGKENVLAAIIAFEELDSVLGAEPVYKRTAVTCTAPNDSYYSVNPAGQPPYEAPQPGYPAGQPSLQNIGYEAAWDAVISSGVAATTVKVGVIEDGFNKLHDDLSANAVPGHHPNSQGHNTPYHGTHVAGIIGAVTGNSKGVAGVGNGRSNKNNIKVAPLNWMNNNGDYRLDDALQYAANNGIFVCNASFTFIDSWTLTPNPYNLNDYNAIRNYTGLLVCAAGNYTWNIDIVDLYPAAYELPNLIAVANTTYYDTLNGSSNYGAKRVQIAAPGTGVLSTISGARSIPGVGSINYPPNSYERLTGTSMSAPHVAGVAAMAKSICPSLTNRQLKELIIHNADAGIPALNGKVEGARRLNAHKCAIAAINASKNVSIASLDAVYVGGDFNGDGKPETAAFVKLGNNHTGLYMWDHTDVSLNWVTPRLVWQNTSFDFDKIKGRVAAGDFDGDGKCDIAALFDLGSPNARLFTWFGTSAGVNLVHGAGSWNGTSFDATKATGKVAAGDFNGDGRNEFAVFYDAGGSTTKLFIWKYDPATKVAATLNGSGSWQSTSFSPASITGKVTAGNFDGATYSGKKLGRIAAFYDYGGSTTGLFIWKYDPTTASVALANGSYGGSWTSTTFTASNLNNKVTAGDYNGNGRCDVAAFADYGGSVAKLFVWKIDQNMFVSIDNVTGTWCPTSLAASKLVSRVVSVDYTRDGKCDIRYIYNGFHHQRLASTSGSGSYSFVWNE